MYRNITSKVLSLLAGISVNLVLTVETTAQPCWRKQTGVLVLTGLPARPVEHQFGQISLTQLKS